MPRVLNVEFPGKIVLATKEGNHQGCKAVRFHGPSDFNKFFEDNAGLLVANLHTNNDGTIDVLYTRTLNDEELELLTVRATVIEEMTQERMKDRERIELANIEAAKNEEVELHRLAALGKRCEQVHPKGAKNK